MTHKCKECGKEERNNWEPKHAMWLEGQQLCFSCGHWEELFRTYEPNERIVVEGGHYVAAKEDGPVLFRGFGGRKFIVEFFDGRRLETTNLWHQGTIPAHYRARLPDNAKWGK